MTSISGAGKREMPSSFASDRRQSAEPGPQASTAASAAASDDSGAPPSEYTPRWRRWSTPRATRRVTAPSVKPTASSCAIVMRSRWALAIAAIRASTEGVWP